MNNLQVIGNLGADAEVKKVNEKEFVSFNVADTQRWTDANGETHESTAWVGCALSGDGGNLLQYLKKGTLVFVEGRMTTRVYSSEKARAMVAGIDLHVRHIELVGGRADEVPQKLYTQDGRMIDVSKHFWTADVSVYGSVLYDRAARPFGIDNNGWVTKIVETAPTATEADAQQEDAPFEGETDPQAQELQQKVSTSKKSKK